MEQTTISQALTNLAIVHGLNPDVIADADTSAELIQLIAGADQFASSNVTVASTEADFDFWGTKSSEIQSSIAVANGKITGTLIKQTSGQIVTDWGEGYFLGLKYTKNNAKASSIKVGIIPSASGMALQELDEDMASIMKITDKNTQKVCVRLSDGNVSYDVLLDISELTLAT